jgi:serine/threonine protein kinase
MIEREIFTAVLNEGDPSRQAAYLDGACQGDAALRQRVESLLAEHKRLGSFMEATPLEATLGAALANYPGMQIGPYRLLQEIGEGGMGVVYMAEQTEPVQRKVALKVVKPGMDSRQVMARFEAERQALAMMDHVNIARVLDAGATETRRPYFVMELVHGVPITKYCDDNRLTPRQRLELFTPVCHAIQHAHQKGIIHRDIKPSNVMVTLYDGQAIPKVIDFGVAKATEQKLTARTLFTHYGTMVGTLEYMSPEQAEMSALGVDTRSDIYSLGVLLYELLTGSTPLGHKRLKEAEYGEILRLIKEEEPAKPSTRLSESGAALPSISAQRQTEPAKLTKLVRGELDWIVMKCLEKDRNRRYVTANGLAADVERYLNDEAVQACPPSTLYRLRKLASRRKGALVSISAVAVATFVALAALAVSTGLVWRANQDLKESLQREQQESYFHRITLAHRDLSADNVRRARKLL